MNKDLGSLFKQARKTSTPIIAIATPDPRVAQQLCVAALNGAGETAPVFAWDAVRGIVGVNKAGKDKMSTLLANEMQEKTRHPVGALIQLQRLEAHRVEDAVVFIHNAQLFWKDPVFLQAAQNLRDPFKSSGSMLVFLTTPGAMLPTELRDDAFLFDEKLPDDEQLHRIIAEIYAAANIQMPRGDALRRHIDALVGLAAFPAEQALAMSMLKSGVDLDALWDRKRAIVSQVRGLSVWRGGERFGDIGGLENVKDFNRAIVRGERAPRVVMFLDEIEKAVAGVGTDTSGVKSDLVGVLLTWMQDNDVDGELFLGPPGTGKTNIAKAIANEAEIPMIQFDLAGMQSSLVGSSGENIRAGLKVVDAIAAGHVLVIGTCNEIDDIPMALRRRFKLATFFFDLPTPEGREQIWRVYRERYKLAGEATPNDDGWTGAEIRECCQKAWRLHCPLVESARYVVPVARSMADEIKRLRQSASGRFLSTEEAGGTYRFEEQLTKPYNRKLRRDTQVITGAGEA